MDKITEALKKILPAESVAEVAKAVEEMMGEQVAGLDAEYEERLNEAFTRVTAEKESLEALAEQGYQQAYEIIGSLMQRLDEQREEFETALEEGFEEAFGELEKEKGKNENIEVELYEEFDKKLKEMKEFMVDRLDVFLSEQEVEIYESAKRDVLTDPNLAEQRVVVAKMAELLSDYMSNDDFAAVNNGKIEEAHKAVEDVKSQLRMLEAKNVRLATQNTKLTEAVRQAEGLITEATKVEKKERASKAKNASGRGNRVVAQEVIREFAEPTANNKSSEGDDLREAHDPLNDLLVLSGISES